MAPTDRPAKILAFIALGSNLGDSDAILRAAMDRLQTLSDEPLLKSSLWETAPVDCPPGSPSFLNAVVGLALRAGQTPETHFGRRPKQALNEPRPLDLDLISFGREVRSSSQLTLPHPRACRRRFVLEPLAEIAPHGILPGQSQSIARLLAELPADDAPVQRKSLSS